MNKKYAIYIFTIYALYAVGTFASNLLDFKRIDLEVFNVLHLVILVLGVLCFNPKGLSNTGKLYLSTLTFLIFPIYCLYADFSNYFLSYKIMPIKQHLIAWTGILCNFSLFAIYAHFKSLVSNFRSAWYYVSPAYLVRSVQGKENVITTVFWFGFLLIVVFKFAVYESLRYLLYQYNIGDYYTYGLVISFPVFLGFWARSVYKSAKS
ncbi:hypothetical protein [Microbulbifer sp.]|uniref:hypothetical protein n=1 Tax=Microbulbifer sp. TaxID=1908541 RepID=UPI003F3E370D